jgi:hypothetical protein
MALFTAPAQANLVQNGSFENVTATTTSRFSTGGVANWSNSPPSLEGEAIVLPSWYTNGYLFPAGPVGVAGPLPQYSPDGGNWVFSDGDFMNSPITQTITGLVPGNFYTLSFYQGLVQDTEPNVTVPGPVTGYWHVSLGSSVFDSAPMAADGSIPTISNWALETTTLKALNATEVLSFFSVGGGVPPLVLLDGVSLTEVPEPASAALLVVGFVGLGAYYRRTRWQRITG